MLFCDQKAFVDTGHRLASCIVWKAEISLVYKIQSVDVTATGFFIVRIEGTAKNITGSKYAFRAKRRFAQTFLEDIYV